MERSTLMVNVITFNLHVNYGQTGVAAWQKRKVIIGEFLFNSEWDICLTQEGTEVMHNDLMDYLDEICKVAEPRAIDDESCMIYYQKKCLSLIDEGTFWLSDTTDKKESRINEYVLPRICTWAIFESKSQPQSFAVFNTHLEHEDKEVRNKQLNILLKEITKLIPNNIPVIVGGNFNMKLNTQLKNKMNENGYISIYHGDSHSLTTFHNYTGEIFGDAIDHLFYRVSLVDLKAHQICHNVSKEAAMSDHYPVKATFVINK